MQIPFIFYDVQGGNLKDLLDGNSVTVKCSIADVADFILDTQFDKIEHLEQKQSERYPQAYELKIAKQIAN